MPTSPALRSRRRFLRFSVRGLIVVVLVLGAGFGWLVRSARVQREAVAGIKREGGSVFYASGRAGSRTLTGQRPWVPLWLVSAIGVDYFDRASVVYFFKDGSDKGLAHVKDLRTLDSLVLLGTNVTDDGLAPLHGLTNLSNLCLSGCTQITDAGLVHLKGMTKLSQAVFRDIQVTDTGLVHLYRLTNLKYLTLSDTPVTDAGVEELRRTLPTLEIIRSPRFPANILRSSQSHRQASDG